MNVIRWPALLLLAAVIAAMVAVDSSETPPLDTSATVERTIGAAIGNPNSLASAWYCGAGTIIDGGLADHTIVLANPSDIEARVSMSVYPVLAPQPLNTAAEVAVDDSTESDDIAALAVVSQPEATILEPVVLGQAVPPRSILRVRLAEIEGVGGEYAAALVESNVGELLVEHELSGPTGSAIATCASASSDEWYFAAGSTRKGGRQFVSLFNPFPGDAVVDLSFVADGALRSPQAYNGLVVPSGSVIPIEITNVVTLFDTVSTTVSVRTGRVIADRLLAFDGSEGPAGLSVAVGAASPSPIWVFPGGIDAGAPTGIVISNPSLEGEAVVDVEIWSASPSPSFIEPIGVTIRAGHAEVVVVTPGAGAVTVGRVVDGSRRVEPGEPFWIVVRQVRGDPMVAERFVIATGEDPQAASASLGVNLAATTHAFTSGSGIGRIAVVHPARDRLTDVTFTVLVDGQRFDAGSFELAPTSRTIIDLEGLGIPANAIVVIESAEPVLIERQLDVGAGLVWAPVAPQLDTASEPDIPFP